MTPAYTAAMAAASRAASTAIPDVPRPYRVVMKSVFTRTRDPDVATANHSERPVDDNKQTGSEAKALPYPDAMLIVVSWSGSTRVVSSPRQRTGAEGL